MCLYPNGVDPEKYSPSIDGSKIKEKYDIICIMVIGFIGTFFSCQGAEVLAEAYGILVNENPEYRYKTELLIISDGVKMLEKW